jgi:hypothetical protein
LQLSDLQALVYPATTLQERQQMLEGMSLFTLAHTAAEGAGPMANQPFCLGCHQSSAEALPNQGLVSGSACGVAGSTCVSPNAFLSVPFSERHRIRNVAPPEFGGSLLKVLEQASKKKDSKDSGDSGDWRLPAVHPTLNRHGSGKQTNHRLHKPNEISGHTADILYFAPVRMSCFHATCCAGYNAQRDSF